jgi:limonene-1,2-epoxide hydrolase
MTGIAATERTNGKTAQSAAGVVEAFLAALEIPDIDDAAALLADDVEYTNVSLPSNHGRAKVEKLLRTWFVQRGLRFRVHYHAISTEGDVVLTERTDEIRLGPVVHRFWVCGRFEVREGKITLWRDYFDWRDLLVGLARGLGGAIVPALNRRWPGDA